MGLTDSVTMGTAIVAQESLYTKQIFAGAGAAAGIAPPLLCTNTSASFLLAAVSEANQAMRARLAAVSC